MENNFAKKFNLYSLLGFVLPSIIMTIFTNSYSIVDGLFISRFVSSNALAAVNIVTPMFATVCSTAIMFATGGSATISKMMGEDKNEEAKGHFTAIIICNFVLILIMLFIAYFSVKPLLYFMGADDLIYNDAYNYFINFILFFPAVMLHVIFQIFFMTAGKPKISLLLTLIGGVINIIGDYIFIVLLSIGTKGAAIASGLGYAIPGLIGLCVFLFNRKLTIYFVKPIFNFKLILKSISNGLSEMVTYISMAITILGFNILLMKYIGADGVAAITAILYTRMFMDAVYVGYMTAVSPIVGYKYGMGDHEQQKFIFKSSLCFIGFVSIIIFILTTIGSDYVMRIFFSKGTSVFIVAKNGFIIFAFSYLFSGINIFTSAYFTALSNGKISATISILRTFVFVIASFLILPKVFYVDGIWLAIPVAESLAFIVSIRMLFTNKVKYNYSLN